MLEWDPVRAARQAGGRKGRLRRAALAAMRPYTAHQDELNAVLVAALRGAEARIAALEAEAADHRQELLRLAGEVGDGELALMIEGMRARPASGHPALTMLDAAGQRVLRFSQAANDGATYRGFEDIFRGDEQLVRERQEADVDAFAGVGWVLDIGCGRGEFLDALRDRGVGARGIDLDRSMVDRCRERGHDVELAEGLNHLRGLEDGSVPGIYAAQVVEHLGADQLSELLALVERKLVPGGLVILETVNGHNPAALKAFWTDTTHHHPLYPEVLLAHCRLAGFGSGEVRFREETGDFNADVYRNRDYAVHARRHS